MSLLLFDEAFVQSAATSAVSLLVLPTSAITPCFSPVLVTPLGSAIPGKVIKGLFCPSSPSQVSNEQVV